VHAGLGKVPVAPGDEAREVGLQIGAAKDAVLDVEAVLQQNLAVPQFGGLAAQVLEMRRDVGAARLREHPRSRRISEVEGRHRNDPDVARIEGGGALHAAITLLSHDRIAQDLVLSRLARPSFWPSAINRRRVRYRRRGSA
jgi:hypothetical protein